LNWNVFDGGISASRIRQAAAQLKIADADLFSSR